MKTQTGPLANIPLWIIEHSGVSGQAIRLWGLLYAKYTTRSDDYPVAEPSRPQLATDLRCSVDSIDRWLKTLVDSGALTVIPQTSDTQQRAQNRYELTLVQGGRRDAATLPAAVRPPPLPKVFPDGDLPFEPGHEPTAVSVPSRSVVPTYVRFNQFWAKYPRALRKQRAKVAWLKLKVEQDTDLWVAIMTGLRRWLEHWEIEGTRPQYIPYASTWLRDRCWEDDLERPQVRTLSKQSQQIVSSSQRFLARHTKDTP